MYYCRGKASHQALPGALILQEADFSVFTPLLLPLFVASSSGSLSISEGVAAPGSSFYLPPGGKGLSSSIVATNSWGGGGGQVACVTSAPLNLSLCPAGGTWARLSWLMRAPLSLRVGRDPSHQTTWDDSQEIGVQSWKKGNGCYTNT